MSKEDDNKAIVGLWKVQNGKIIEEIGLDDGVTALTQLGLIKQA